MIDLCIASAALSSFQCQIADHDRRLQYQSDMERMRRQAEQNRQSASASEFAYDPEDPSATIMIARDE